MTDDINPTEYEYLLSLAAIKEVQDKPTNQKLLQEINKYENNKTDIESSRLELINIRDNLQKERDKKIKIIEKEYRKKINSIENNINEKTKELNNLNKIIKEKELKINIQKNIAIEIHKKELRDLLDKIVFYAHRLPDSYNELEESIRNLKNKNLSNEIEEYLQHIELDANTQNMIKKFYKLFK